MSFRILNQAPQYLLPSGKVNNGGRLYFYETDLSTPKLTWSDEALNVPNSNPVLMDGAGRTMTDVWGDGEYGVVMTDAAGVTIWTRNNVRSDAGAGTQIPALLSGQFLTNDGSVLQWQQIVLLPDLTGTNGNILYSDGALPYWAPPPSVVVPDPPIVNTGTSVKIGTFLLQTGTATAPASGARQTSVSVTFPTVFTTCLAVLPSVRTANATAGLQIAVPAVTTKNANGFTVQFDSDDFGQSNATFINAVPFDWVAVGIVPA